MKIMSQELTQSKPARRRPFYFWKKVKHVALFIATNLLAWYGCHGVEWAWNILRFFTVILLIAFIAGMGKEQKRELIETYRDGKHLPLWMDVLFYLMTVAILVAFGHWAWGAVWFFIFGTDYTLREKAKESPAALQG